MAEWRHWLTNTNQKSTFNNVHCYISHKLPTYISSSDTLVGTMNFLMYRDA